MFAKRLTGASLFLALCSALFVVGEARPARHPRVEAALVELTQAVSGPRSSPGVELREGRILVVVERGVGGERVAQRLAELGGLVEGTYGSLVKVWLPPGILIETAELPGVNYVRRPHVPIPLSDPEPRLASEGVAVLGASLFHAKGVLGQGVRVAVIDVGFGSLTHAQRAGEIRPEAIAWTRDYTGTGVEGGGPHGTAVAQVVHNMAPRAELYLARVGTEVDLAQAVVDCVHNGVDIIVHAVGWVNTEFGDGTGVISDIVRLATSAGILWVNAAGNHAQRHWLGIPRMGPDRWLEYAPGLQDLELVVEIPGLVQMALTWDEWPRSLSDLDLYLLDAAGAVVAASRSMQSGDAPPAEHISYFAERGRYTVRVRAQRAYGPVAIQIFSLGHDLYPHVPRSSILAPGNAREAFTVGAIGLQGWSAGPQQSYSSQGPTNDGRLKPDLIALDGVTNFVYPLFFGTSAAAPHVGGAVALLLAQARARGESLGLGELRELVFRWAMDMGDPGPDYVYGKGRLRLFVEQARAERTILTPQGTTVAPGETVTVQVKVRMPSTQMGGLELRETLPAGLVGLIEDRGGADRVQEGRELVWRWDLLLPGEERSVRYRVAVPQGYLPGTYVISGAVNHDPVTGDASLLVTSPLPEEKIRAVCAPNPVVGGEKVWFTVEGADAWDLRLRIHDLAGRLVYDSGWQPGPSYQWNLQDDRGRIVAGGVYLYWLEVRGAEGRIVRTGVERLLVVR